MKMDPERIADELAIRELVHRYADAIVRRDERAWFATWATDAEWHVLGEVVCGREHVVEKWRDLMSRLSFVHQIASGGILSFEESGATHDRAHGHDDGGPCVARGRFNVNEYATTDDGPGLLMLGVYDDLYVKRDGQWLFRRRRLTPLYFGPPDMSGKPMDVSIGPVESTGWGDAGTQSHEPLDLGDDL